MLSHSRISAVIGCGAVLWAACVLPVAAAHIGPDTVQAAVCEDPEDAYGAEGDVRLFGSLIGWEIEASSELAPSGTVSYGASNLNDESPATAWVEGEPGYGIGEFVVFRFPRSVFGSEDNTIDSANFYAFRLENGYCKNRATWKANSRVKAMKFFLNETPLALVALVDTIAPQYFRFTTVYVKPGDFFKLEIVDVYPGTKDDDTGLSELWAVGDF